jgi:predicted DNA-binding transcriptional regulator AlpA
MAEFFRQHFIRYDTETGRQPTMPSGAKCRNGFIMTTPTQPDYIRPALLKQKQLAQYCDVSYSTIRRWRKDDPNFPKPFHKGSVLRWRVIDIDAFIAAHLQLQEVA